MDAKKQTKMIWFERILIHSTNEVHIPCSELIYQDMLRKLWITSKIPKRNKMIKIPKTRIPMKRQIAQSRPLTDMYTKSYE